MTWQAKMADQLLISRLRYSLGTEASVSKAEHTDASIQMRGCAYVVLLW